MLANKANVTAGIALLSTCIRVFSGPIILLVLSGHLTPEEQSLYFVFFSLAAARQLIESGAGNVLKQRIATYYLQPRLKRSIVKIKSYVGFCFTYYTVIGLFFSLVLFTFGTWFIASKNIDIDWVAPWFLFLILNCISTILVPVLIVLDAFQLQTKLQKYQLFSSLTYSIVLIFSMLQGYGLYSLVLSLLASNIFLYFFSIRALSHLGYLFDFKSNVVSNSQSCFINVRDFLARSFVSFFGIYCFWNAVPLACFYYTSPAYSAKFNLTWALLKSGFYMVQVINLSQATIYTKLLVEPLKCIRRFKQIFFLCIFALVFGYSLFYSIKRFEWGLFIGTLDGLNLIGVMCICFLFAPIVLVSDFSRCLNNEFFAANIFYSSIATVGFLTYGFAYDAAVESFLSVLILQLLINFFAVKKYLLVVRLIKLNI